jgi:hypothetical protein
MATDPIVEEARRVDEMHRQAGCCKDGMMSGSCYARRFARAVIDLAGENLQYRVDRNAWQIRAERAERFAADLSSQKVVRSLQRRVAELEAWKEAALDEVEAQWLKESGGE